MTGGGRLEHRCTQVLLCLETNICEVCGPPRAWLLAGRMLSPCWQGAKTPREGLGLCGHYTAGILIWILPALPVEALPEQRDVKPRQRPKTLLPELSDKGI